MRSIIIIITMLIAICSILAQGMTLESFLDTLITRHPIFEVEDYSTEIARLEQEGTLGYLDWAFSSGSYYSYSKPLQTSSFGAEEMLSIGINAIAQKKIESTGGTVSAGFSTGYTDQKLLDMTIPMSPEPMIISSGPSYFYNNSISANYTQPLIQNYRGNLDRLGYDLGQYYIDMARLEAVENEENFVLSMATRYIDWTLMVEQVAITRRRLDLAKEQLERTERMRDANLIDRVDILRAEDAVRGAKHNLVLLESQEQAVREELSVMIACERLCKSRPEFDLYEIEELPDLEVLGKEIRENSRLIATMRKQLDIIARQRESYIEMERPILNLDLEAGIHKADGDFIESWILNRPELSLSLQYIPNIGRTELESNIQAVDVQMLQLENSIEQTAISIEASARNLLVQIKNMEIVLEMNLEQIESAEQKTVEEIKLWENGRGQLNFVIQSRDSEQSAKFTYAQNAATYHKMVLQFRSLMDDLYGETLQ